MSIDSLYRLAKTGDETARKQLFQVLTDSFRLVLQPKVQNLSDAQDVLQDALLAVAKSYQVVKIEVSFAAWANSVLQNRLKEYYRVKKVRGDRFEPMLDSDAKAPRWDVDPIFRKNLLDCLKDIFSTNANYARVLSLHYQGLDAHEVCDRMKIRRSGMYVLLSRARRLMKICLERKGSDR